MKLSNCNFLTHAKRSQSRSPVSFTSNSANTTQTTFYTEDDYPTTYAQFQELVKHQMRLNVTANKDMNAQKKRLSTTSWGKLKHSKSSSSNLGGSNSNEEFRSANKNTQESASRFQSGQQPATSSSDENNSINIHLNNSSSSDNNNIFNNFHNSNQRMSRRERNKAPTNVATATPTTVNAKTTSFSQLRQRSLSSNTLNKLGDAIPG